MKKLESLVKMSAVGAFALFGLMLIPGVAQGMNRVSATTVVEHDGEIVKRAEFEMNTFKSMAKKYRDDGKDLGPEIFNNIKRLEAISKAQFLDYRALDRGYNAANIDWHAKINSLDLAHRNDHPGTERDMSGDNADFEKVVVAPHRRKTNELMGVHRNEIESMERARYGSLMGKDDVGLSMEANWRAEVMTDAAVEINSSEMWTQVALAWDEAARLGVLADLYHTIIQDRKDHAQQARFQAEVLMYVNK